MDNSSTPFQFPCEYPLKIVGLADGGFETAVLTIIRQSFPALSEDAIQRRLSRDGKYLSLTVTVLAPDKKTLDDLYIELSNHPNVIMAL